jgi:hypothetical protein
LWTSSQRGYRRRCMMTSRPVYVLALSTVETEGGWGWGGGVVLKKLATAGASMARMANGRRL